MKRFELPKREREREGGERGHRRTAAAAAAAVVDYSLSLNEHFLHFHVFISSNLQISAPSLFVILGFFTSSAVEINQLPFVQLNNSRRRMDPPASWESLRKQARKLETQLDEQMHLYRKLVSTKVDSSNDNDLESGIDQLLKKLQQVNVQMQAWVSSVGSEIYSHTLTRHQEILQDLTQEFKRLCSSHRAKKEHASLLEDFREFDHTSLDLEDGGGSYEQALLKERASLHRNTGQIDSVISQAQETLKSLVFQRSTFGGINSKISNVSSRLPTVNHILSSITKKKSMDTIILSLVASVCTFLILIYWWTK